jgi:hypothetical protein
MARRPRGSKPVSHADAARRLSAQPHVWGLVGVYRSRSGAKSTSGHILRATFCGFTAYAPAGSYETRIRLDDEGWALEARHMGSPVSDLALTVLTHQPCSR